MVVALTAHAVVAALLPMLASRLGARLYLVAAVVPAATFGWLLTRIGPVTAGAGPVTVLRWVPDLRLEPAFRLGPLQLFMALIVTGIGALVLVYARYYHADDAGGFGRSAAGLLAFAGAMLGLVIADDLFTLYVFWELTTVFSFVLIGGDGFAIRARRAAVQALLTTTVGGLTMLFGFILLGEAAGTYRISGIVAHPPAASALTLAAAPLVLVGVAAKSAQAPLHAWLPSAMVAPTPVSAFLHAAAMVKAGVFLLATLTPAFATAGGFGTAWTAPAAALGAVTTLIGGARALTATDLKHLLACSTISQLGLLTLLLGLGWRTTSLAGMTLLLAHALAKAALFMTVGVIHHRAGTRDLRALSGVGRHAPVLCLAAVLACASMAGLPPTVGFVAKEAALDGLWGASGAGHLTLLAVLDTGAALTVAYSARFLWGAFATKRDVAFGAWHPASPLFSGPTVVLAAAGVALGFAAPSVGGLLAGYAATVPAGGESYHLALWHGLGLPLILTALALAAGGALFWSGRALEAQHGWLRPPAPRATPPPPGPRSRWARLSAWASAQHAYERTVVLVGRLALAVTARTQIGSLPAYLTIILIVVLAVPGKALLGGLTWPRDLPLWDLPIQLPLGIVVLVSAVFLARARRRLTGALLLGAVGYGIGAMFVVEGAPDLALAQFLVETLSLLAFVFVLRRMPDRYAAVDRSPVLRWPRLAVSAGVGVFVALFALATETAHRGTTEAARQYIARSPAQTGATNVVSGIVVDFRAFDTLGEITVLAVIALGVASLLAARAPVGAPTDVTEPAGTYRPGGGGTVWIRSVLIEVTARALFPVVLVFALYLLFAGHTRTGGGFAGGLVAGLAFTLRYVAGSRDRVGPAVPAPPARVIGAGLTVAAVAALVPALFGGPVLDSYEFAARLPGLGHVELVTSLFFDIGVFLVVVGVVLDLLGTLGIGVDKESDATGAAVAGATASLDLAPTRPGQRELR
jgi:multicomponent Na+:H+ antiporter subunit A